MVNKKTKIVSTFVVILIFVAVFSIIIATKRPSGEKELRLAYVMSTGGTSDAGAKKFAELVEKRTDGRIKVKLYPNGVLGNERIIVESLALRGIDMAITGSAIIGWYAPEYGVLEAPFLFRDYDHLDRVLYGSIGEKIEKAINKKADLHFLAHFRRGPRYLTTTNKKVHSPEDLNGLKLRVPELPIYIHSWATFGANPTPVAYSDMFMALKQGVVEGQENPLEVIYTSHLYEIQKYVMETRHLLGFYSVVVGDYFYEKFSKQQQAIITEAIKDAAEYQNALLDEYEKNYKNELIESGVEFIKVDREAFEQLALEKLPDTFKENWVPGIFQEIQNIQ